MSNSPLLSAAQQHYQAGQLAEAERLFAQALESQPQNIKLLSWLALIANRLGKLEESIAYYKRILALNPKAAEAHSNLGSVLCKQGQMAAAIAHHRQALALMPKDADAHYNLGVALYEAGQLEEAIAHYQQTVAQNPNHVSAHTNLGMAFYQQGKLEAAADHYNRAIALNPDHVNALNGLGVVLFHLGQLEEAIGHYQRAISLNPEQVSAYNNLGTVYQKQGKPKQAMAQYERAIALNPNHASAYDNLGTVLQEQGRLAEAIAHYRQAITLDPNAANAYNNLGSALKEQGNLSEAVACCQQAIRLQPNHADAHNNYASSLVEQGKFGEAIVHYEQAIHYQPEHVNAHLNLGIILLMLGDFQRGFKEYHWRWRSKQCPDLRYPQALWDGSDLTGKVILLTAEQGFGDTIQFARYAPLVAQRGGCVIVACQKPLLRLLSSLPGIDQCVDRDKVNVQTHVHIPLLDLPLILGTTPESIPAQMPYLSGAVSTFSPLPTPHSPHLLKIGFVWASNPDNSTAKKRSCPLSYFLPLLKIPGIGLYSLQKDVPESDAVLLEAQPEIQDLRPLIKDFADTAAAIAQLDLVISVDTAVAHLAGALGKPVWTLLPYVADWRWLLQREDSPWYPTMHLFRQTQPGDWAGVFERVIARLEESGERGENRFPPSPSPYQNSKLKTQNSTPLPTPHSPLPISCRHGTLLYNPNDDVGKSLELYGEWSEGEVGLFQSLLKSGDTVVEVGANIGAHTVVFAKAVGTSGKVVAIEPERLRFQTLCANLALNGFTNAYCYPVLLGETGVTQASGSNPSTEGVIRPGNTASDLRQFFSLDNFELPHCHFFKIDASGQELEIFHRAIHTIQQSQPTLYLRNCSPQANHRLIQFLDDLGYQLYWHRPSLYNPNNFFQNSQNIFGTAISVNILGFHRNHRIKVDGMEQIRKIDFS
ncbi:FkbM family methyltransferase [Kovacikia minuta CCNUW1]|uniref:FkbM family methyltransferase n=1 Tax=Kovacikia minuta TaxID=2931930 RepID=UPI001CCA89C2|nr:FkbM family methyltransferase [Kovacikia minuta]UBF29373.1 FkbM family methyltransferase [Kovacikia minuta CCNUW1]